MGQVKLEYRCKSLLVTVRREDPVQLHCIHKPAYWQIVSSLMSGQRLKCETHCISDSVKRFMGGSLFGANPF